jgi:putative ubiquitin-RnfH superfamily antitoxin RatB of RatAB toxin-antitoxin module
VGIFGQFVLHDHVLASGDRIEIYRPLVADPKASRHARVAKKRADRDSDRNMRA